LEEILIVLGGSNEENSGDEGNSRGNSGSLPEVEP